MGDGEDECWKWEKAAMLPGPWDGEGTDAFDVPVIKLYGVMNMLYSLGKPLKRRAENARAPA